MAAKVKVGDIVVLNDEGIKIIWGSNLGLSHMKNKRMKIISVDSESMTFPKESYLVEVSDPEINTYFLNDYMFDLVK